MKQVGREVSGHTAPKVPGLFTSRFGMFKRQYPVALGYPCDILPLVCSLLFSGINLTE